MFDSLKGQALFETLFTLPIVMGGLSLILCFLYSWTSHFLIDHWVYQSALCLAENQAPRHCQKELVEKLKQVPFLTFQIDRMSLWQKKVLVQVKTRQPLQLHSVFTETLHLPLRIDDFRRYQ